MRGTKEEEAKIAYLEKQLAKRKAYLQYLDFENHRSQDALANLRAREKLDQCMEQCEKKCKYVEKKKCNKCVTKCNKLYKMMREQ